MTNYALFHNGKQVSKAHSTRRPAVLEAHEYGAVIRWVPDFAGDGYGVALADGYEVKPVEDER